MIERSAFKTYLENLSDISEEYQTGYKIAATMVNFEWICGYKNYHIIACHQSCIYRILCKFFQEFISRLVNSNKRTILLYQNMLNILNIKDKIYETF